MKKRAINTAAFHATSRPKTLAALPSTVDAIKHHIFNDVIWPNLTDEDGGVGPQAAVVALDRGAHSLEATPAVPGEPLLVLGPHVRGDAVQGEGQRRMRNDVVESGAGES